ncbi:hypothetical protein [Curtobacterium sp. ISL-83]|uniref:hypothetical protein n=1 Tax=Curtobacterium sp. ISL-83 TaxID=2819145 RepID=UPI001BE5D2BF|nr:hypothetical protein [Curtobacterium sp. ISL-83]MBT2502252.1 hypothetical protein [Curtobacterium sp. ISL-83]
MKSLRDVQQACLRDIRAARELPWGLFSAVFDSFGLYLLALLLLVGALAIASVFLLPSYLISSDSKHVLAYFIAPVVLVALGWGIFAWSLAASVGSLVVAVLGRQATRSVVQGIGASLARITTWTGRITMPVLLASLGGWTLGIGLPAHTEPVSVIRNVAVLQLAMLFLSLTFVVCFEAVHVVWRQSDGLPWSVRVPAAGAFAFAAWMIARRCWRLRPSVETLLNSIVPAQLNEVDHAEIVRVFAAQSPDVPWVFGVVFVGVILGALIHRDVRVSRQSRATQTSPSRSIASA